VSGGDAVAVPAPALRPPAVERLVRAPLRRFVAYVWDNPSAEHDARTILSSPKIGMWLGLEVLLVLIGCSIAFFALPESDRVFRQAQVAVGTGPYLISAALITVSAFLTLIVPLRASGLMEGPRWRGYMDQLITTGVTPLRYYAGKWATSQPFFLGLLAATLPIVVLFALLGGVSLGRTLVAYVLLYAYCNLLLAVACALGVVLHEVVALLATWLIFSTATIFEYTPTPSTFAAWTPHRFLLQPFVGPMAGAGAGPAEGLYGAPLPFGFEVPWAAWALGLWAVVFLLAGVTCCLGPLHAFVPGLNNFGAVVLAGDAKRLFFRRIRPFLTRRVELAFLFENRGPRLVRRTLTLRALQQVGILAVLAVVLFGAALHPVVIAEMRDLEDEMTVLHALAAGLWLLALLYVLATGRTDAMQRQRVGPLRIPLLAYDVGVFFVAAAVLYGVHALSIGAVWSDLAQAGATRRWDAVRTPEAYFVRTSTILGIMTTTVFGAFLLMKVVGCRVLGRGTVFFLTLLYLLALLLVPVFFVALSASLLQAEEPSIRPLGRPLWVLGQISPATAIASVAGLPRELRDVDSWLVERGFWLWHAIWIGLLSVQALASHRGLWREAALADGDARPLLTSGAPCARCHSRLAAPVDWTWWGGLLGPLLLGYVRCAECHAHYRRATGRASAGLVLLALAARVVVVLGALALLGVYVWTQVMP